MATSGIAEHVGRVLGGRYRLSRPLGTGASAHVYVAEDVTLGRRVAVKLLHPALAGDASFLRRFRAEARVVAALRHPNIVRVYDWGEDQGAPFLVMELLEGGSLRSLLDRGSLLSPAQAAATGAEAAHALEYAHRRGLIHRDIKPANLLFDEEGRVCIADFGLARALAEATWTEPAGALLGTARYAAPEQVQGAQLDGRSDVYALGLVMVEAVTGKVPFAADTTIGTLMARVHESLTAPGELGPLAAIVARAGTSDPKDRIDAAELARQLHQVMSELPAPMPLPLAGPLVTGELDGEAEGEVTELQGKPKPTLFDGEALDGRGRSRGSSRRRSRAARRAERVAAEAWAPPAGALGGGAPAAGAPGAGAAPAGAAWTGAAGAVGAASAGAWAPPPGLAVPVRRRRHWGRWLVVLLLAVAAAAGGGVAVSGVLEPSHPVPVLRNDSEAQAARVLGAVHLHMRVTARPFDPSVPQGDIVSQRPGSGKLREGSTVSVEVSAGPPPVAVPDLTGLTQAQAAQRLVAAGLALGQVSNRIDATVPAGRVVDWTGKGGRLARQSPVELVISSGPPTVAVPDVHGKSFGDAKALLATVQLTAVESDQFSDTVLKGQVVTTTPPAGASAANGSQVTVVVSRGQDLVAVPDVRGDSVDVATRALESSGFTVSGVIGSPDRPVFVTNPANGALVRRGFAVKLYTS